ncbi:MAG: hypothetical protein KDF56_05570 [Ottowia sp.]|nr:hypothetical protein [Ottowia sp.]
MFESLKLDVDALELSDARAREVAKIIADVTEEYRARERDSKPLQPMGLLGIPGSYADTLSWEVILTFSECTFAAAQRAGLGVVELLNFAHDHCRPREFWTLYWCATAWAIAESAANNPPQTKRGRGRPKKYDWDMLKWFNGEREKYLQQHPGTKATDNAVLTWYFEQLFKKQSLRGSRVREAEFQTQLRNIAKELSDRRNPPGKKIRKNA